MDELDLSRFDEPVEIPHDFEIDLHNLVVLNHKFTLEAIDRSEAEDIANLPPELAGDTGRFHDRLKTAANNLAMVGLVIRLEHWIRKLAGNVPDASTDSNLISCLTLLEKLGAGPVPISFFQELVNVRDSIVHADSKANWVFGHPRHVAKQYADVYGNVRVEEEDLKKAVQNAINQVTWYDQKLHERESHDG